MIDYILVILIIFGIILIIMTYEKKDPVLAILGTVVWFVNGLGTLEVEIPYQLYNSTSNQIETGVQLIETAYPLAYLFMTIGIIMFISFMTLVFGTFKGK